VLLVDPFENEFPEVIEDCLEDGSACVCACNRRGTLLAVGCHDGRCVIWDFDTRGIARVLNGHIHPVTSVSWSRNGRKLLSSSTDWTLKFWDVLSANVDLSIRFESAVLLAQMHPRDNAQCIVCPMMELPVVVNLKTGEKRTLPHSQETEKGSKMKTNISAASYNKKGDKIYIGDGKGIITIIDSSSLQILQTIKVPGGASIKSIQFSKSGKDFLINSTDRIIRAYDTETLAYREFQDCVNRMQWKQCCFSCDADYIIGGSAQKAEHNIYIWNRDNGRLVKILEGPKEGIMDLLWHPVRPIIASCSTSGVVYIWSTNYTENWSAFAPDFTELQENEEYNEREDEFDIVDENESENKKKRVEEDEEVDIITIDKVAAYSSESDDDLWFIPTELGSSSTNFSDTSCSVLSMAGPSRPFGRGEQGSHGSGVE
jgi:COMPASS component SWD1